jgi:hypothetical protein
MYEIEEETNPYRFKCFLTLATYISLTYEMGTEGKIQQPLYRPGQALKFPGG